jgi:hypothetical protein
VKLSDDSPFLASFGSIDNVKSSEVPTQIDVLNSISAEGTWVADSLIPTIPTKGYFRHNMVTIASQLVSF